MHWLIVGAGALGSLIGGRLLAGNEKVTLVVRPYAEEVLTRDGLHLSLDGQEQTVTPAVATAIDEAFARHGPFDAIALTMKTFAVAEAVEALATIGATAPPVVTFQNGVGSEELVVEGLPDAAVVAASVTTPVEIPEIGTVRSVSKGGIALAAVQGNPDLEVLVQSLTAAGFVVSRIEDYRSMVWSKLLLNIIGNATSAILGWPPERVFANRDLFTIELAAWQEARSVMKALGLFVVSLPGYRLRLYLPFFDLLPNRLLQFVLRRAVAGGRAGKMPSLYLDLEAGRKTLEIGALNGAVVDHGHRAGVPTPVNAALTRIVTHIANGTLEWEAYRDRPQRLVQDVRSTITATVAVGTKTAWD